jgi:hypothetical protein
MVRGGGNVAIAVVRQALKRLADLLAKDGHSLPKTGTVQGDNGKEIKCKSFFAYLAHLVDTEQMDTIFAHFLIVKHTHNNTDTGFSKVSALLQGVNSLLTPLQLEVLLRENLTGQFKPLLVEKLEPVYDFVAAVKPYINKNIKYFYLPQYYMFTRRQMVTAMFYRMLRTPEIDFWLPPEPEANHITDEGTIVTDPFAFVGGRALYYKYIGMSADLSAAVATNMKLVSEVLAFEAQIVTTRLFRETLEDIIGKIERTAEFFELDDTPEGSTHFNDLLGARKTGALRGYIVWLKKPNPTGKENDELPDPLLLHLRVKAIIPTLESIQKLSGQFPLLDGKDDGDGEYLDAGGADAAGGSCGGVGNRPKIPFLVRNSNKAMHAHKPNYLRTVPKEIAKAAYKVLNHQLVTKFPDRSIEVGVVGTKAWLWHEDIEYLQARLNPAQILSDLVSRAENARPWVGLPAPDHIEDNVKARLAADQSIAAAKAAILTTIVNPDRHLSNFSKYLAGEQFVEHEEFKSSSAKTTKKKVDSKQTSTPAHDSLSDNKSADTTSAHVQELGTVSKLSTTLATNKMFVFTLFLFLNIFC